MASKNNNNSNSSEFNQIDELLKTGQISNAVEFYNYFKNKTSVQAEQPATIPTSSSSSSISSYSGKRSKKTKQNTLSDYASMLNVPVQSYQKPKFKKACSSNSLAVYANPSLSPAMSMSNLSATQFSPYMPRRSTIYDEYIMDQPSSETRQQFSTESISSMFLNSATSYYHKYKQQQSDKPVESHDDKEMEKRKEEAINRIIRNERIKEIRMKMYEYELLKEYQNLDINQARSAESKSFEDFSSMNENLSEDGLEEQKPKFSKSYINRAYGSGTIFDEYRSNLVNKDAGDDGDEDEGDDADMDNDDEDCESGIEDDDSFCQKKTRINLYSGINFPPNQSKFQLKVSIISAEVKNIINVLKQAELEVSALQRRVQLLEEDLEKTEERLNQATTKLNEASQAADESERQRKSLEARSMVDDERIATLEKQLAEAQIIAEDADRRYDEVARRLAIMEVDLERAEDRAEAAEAKILELEEELKVVGNNMKSLEVSEQEAIQREESYEEQIRDLSSRLKDAEQRADLGERTMAKLQKEVDRLEDELLAEKEKYKNISEELDQTLNELQGY